MRVNQALGIIVAIWVALYFPVWEKLKTLQALMSGPANRMYTHSLAADTIRNAPDAIASFLAASSNRGSFAGSLRQFLNANLRTGLMALAALVVLAVTWRARNIRGALRAWGWAAVAAIVAQGWFWPWYVSWALAPAAISMSRRLRVATLIFSVSALLLYVGEQILAAHFPLFQDWSGLFIMAPPLLYILFSWLIGACRPRKGRSLPTRSTGELRPRALANSEVAR